MFQNSEKRVKGVGMFHSITINYDRNTHTLGQIVECLLFYDEVNLIIKQGCLPDLWQCVGVDGLDRLREYGLVLYVATNAIGCSNIPGCGEDVYYTHLRNADMHYRVCEKSLKTFLATDKLDRGQTKKVEHYVEITQEFEFPDNALTAVREDIYEHSIHKEILQEQLREIDSPLSMFDRVNKYEFRKVERGFVFDTNMTTGELELNASRCGQSGFSFRHNKLLLSMVEVYGLMDFSLQRDSVLYTSPAQSLIVSCKQRNVLERYNKDKRAIDDFERVEVHPFTSIAEAIDSGAKSFEDMVGLLDAAREFKVWKSQLSDTKMFVAEFDRAMKAQFPWTQCVTGKVLRFLFTSAVGILNTPMGILANGLDSLIVDKLSYGGWKPAQFVNGKLKRFMRTE